MGKNLEIERKFFIEMPDFATLDVRRKIRIEQTYLVVDEGTGNQRRVRIMSEGGTVKYFYTEKKFISPAVREENETQIEKDEYDRLLTERDYSSAPVIKTRICFEYEKQMFELDVYPFSEKYAILELELRMAEQEIFFPPSVKIIREVTSLRAYSNAVLATNGKFPDESEED